MKLELISKDDLSAFLVRHDNIVNSASLDLRNKIDQLNEIGKDIKENIDRLLPKKIEALKELFKGKNIKELTNNEISDSLVPPMEI